MTGLSPQDWQMLRDYFGGFDDRLRVIESHTSRLVARDEQREKDITGIKRTLFGESGQNGLVRDVNTLKIEAGTIKTLAGAAVTAFLGAAAIFGFEIIKG